MELKRIVKEIVLVIFLLFSFVLLSRVSAYAGTIKDCECDGTTNVCSYCETFQYNGYRAEKSCNLCDDAEWDWCESDTGWVYDCCVTYRYDNSVWCEDNEDSAVCGNGVVETGEECESDSDCSSNQSCKSCDCQDNIPTCTRCTPVCPAPLSSTPPASNPTDYDFVDFASCTDTGTCVPPTEAIDCYEVVSPQPTIAFLLHPENYPTTLGFTSQTHTGAGKLVGSVDDIVNDFIPVRVLADANQFYMEATFTDTDLDIEAVYAWFTQSGNILTPQTLDLDSSAGSGYKTKGRADFGFMLHKEGGSWVPYIPYIVGDGDDLNDIWKKASYTNNVFAIKGPDGNDMVNVQIANIEDTGKQVKLKFSVSFKQNSGQNNLIANPPTEGNYNVFLMANDTFGFTPYDNYDSYPDIAAAVHSLWLTNEKIRYYNNWIDTTKDWNVDLTPPSADLGVSVDGANLKISWDLNDNLDLYGLVLDLFIDSSYKLNQLDDVEILPLTENVPYTPTEQTEIQVGHLTLGTHLYKVVGMSGKTSSSSITLDVGDNRGGIFYFKITAFDDGGNPIQASESFDLRDWMGTEGGLLYSMGGTDIAVRNFLEENGNPWIGSFIENIVSWRNIAISTELIGDKVAGNPIAPEKSPTVKSYMVRPYESTDVGSYYSTLKSAFDSRKVGLGVIEMPVTTKLSGSLGNVGIKSMSTVNNLSVGGPANEEFVCDGSGIFFVGGDLNIYGKIRNVNANKDACIFVVQGNVYIHGTIEPKQKYEEINAYILADGELRINPDTDLNGEYDGVYINGGIHSLKGVSLKRSLQLKDRLTYPALVVDHHSKYGVLSRILFGGQVNIQKTEVGFR
ncbi:MAG: hypothetical protein UR32_C0003G0020 [candidate division WS6 bacterium GW2011_GWE2_33_157]|nr:MAG: hypothetical protein UR32_C0003G0020 [candidate division WS6 bacterium GW2011_GWE2_33_157]KKP46029.1 MAG: hypothetical protein UR36_C0002G0071 [candidate division WS6 bacterium GW2011_GWF1_33_233]KKP56898.1 MAG: hypothetical protein UR49_C0006G0025 [candidate division WS6 bacterium GW2011_GWF2_33_92]KKP82349.1 MAG: hypothetical protein UR84_C0004G0020 [candidate division WS6 bacterium GW2011_GWD1_35_594]